MKYDVIARNTKTNELSIVMEGVTEDIARKYIRYRPEHWLYARVTGTTELLIMLSNGTRRANFQP